MAAPQRRLKDLGKVVDGRIRKGWPFAAFGGSIKTVNTRAKGFYNPLILCYRNAVLQCLLHTPEFFRYLDCEERCTTPGDGCVFCALRNLALRYWTSTVQEFSQDTLVLVNKAMEEHPERHPDDSSAYGFLRPQGSSVNREMKDCGQQDAHEYLLGTVNMLKHINNNMIHGVRSVAMDRLFRIRLETTWTCGDCGEVHSRRATETGLQIGIPDFEDSDFDDSDSGDSVSDDGDSDDSGSDDSDSDDSDSDDSNPVGSENDDRSDADDPRQVAGCLRLHFATEELQGVSCDSQICEGQKGDRYRSQQIVGGPEILVIQLKRMAMDMYGGSRKVNTRIKIKKRLDMSEWSTRPLKYQLIGVVAHHGDDLRSGHYVAMVRPLNGGDFVICDDEKVRERPMAKRRIFGISERKSEGRRKTKYKGESKPKAEVEAEAKAKTETEIETEKGTTDWQSYLLVYQKVGGKMAKCI